MPSKKAGKTNFGVGQRTSQVVWENHGSMKDIFDFRFAIFDWERQAARAPVPERAGRERHKRPVFRFIPGYSGLFRDNYFFGARQAESAGASRSQSD